MPTTPRYDDEDWGSVAETLGRLMARVKAAETKVATLETQYAADHASLLTIQTRLGLINALLHLW